MKLSRLVPILFLLSAAACMFVHERVSFDDPRVIELMTALKAVDRAALGFTAIERTATLRLESRPRSGYDAMLHVAGRTNRTIAFRHRANSYEWIGEQEIFEGPREYDSADGRIHESITITFETVLISGVPLNKVYVDYRGDDSRLNDMNTRQELRLAIVRPVLDSWGFGR